MAPREAEVLSALKLLRDTPSDILNNHRDLALRTLTQLGRAINAHWIEDEAQDRVNVGVLGGLHRDTVPEAECSQPDTSSQLTVSSTAHQQSNESTLPSCEISMSSSKTSMESTTRKRKRQANKDQHSAALIRAAKKRLPRMLEFCKSYASLSEILQTEQEMQFADKRIDHLKQIDGNKTPTDEQRLLKGLSQLSLAQQFTDWEIARGWKPRLYVLYNGMGARPPKTAGKMTRFAREHGYPKSDHNVLRKGIQRGTNQLLLLRWLNDNSTSSDQKDAAKGILALVTIFEYGLFQALSASELPTLAKSLLQEYESSKVIIDSQSDQRNVGLVSARCISQWFENLSGDFEMISQTMKRRRRDTNPLAHVTSSQTGDGPVARTHVPPVDNRPEPDDEPDATTNCQASDVVYPSINSHELTTFSTFPRAESNPQRIHTDPSFMQLQHIPEELEVVPNPRSHDLAQFSRNTTSVNCSLASDSEPCSMSHEISLFSTRPSNIAIQQHLFVPSSCSAFPGDVRSTLSDIRTTRNIASHELSSSSTIPA